MASVPCAIELEPKTLNPIQINHARELAVVLQKIEPQGALIDQGLHQVALIDEEMGQITKRNDDNNAIIASKIVDGISKEVDYCKTKWQHNCLCTGNVIDSPDEICDKEPLTAPF